MILVIAEQREGKLNRASWETIAAAQQAGGPVKVAVVGSGIDATASDDVAARHPAWLGCGYHVVSANKAALGGSGAAWSALQRMRDGDASYGDAATVGAGLPVLSTLRRLRGLLRALRDRIRQARHEGSQGHGARATRGRASHASLSMPDYGCVSMSCAITFTGALP